MNKSDLRAGLLCSVLLLVIIFHALPGASAPRPLGTLTLTALPDEKSTLTLSEAAAGSELICEGRFSFVFDRISDTGAVIMAKGRLTDAGYMHEHGKLLSKNQPLELMLEGTLVCTRIWDISIEFNKNFEYSR